LAGRFKIVGQVGIGLIIGFTLYNHKSVVIRETYSEKEATAEIKETATAKTLENGKIIYTKDVKSTLTTLPFIKSHEFDYADLLFFMEDSKAQKYAWIVFVLAVIFIITAVSNGANLTDGIDGLAAGSSALLVLLWPCWLLFRAISFLPIISILCTCPTKGSSLYFWPLLLEDALAFYGTIRIRLKFLWAIPVVWLLEELSP